MLCNKVEIQDLGIGVQDPSMEVQGLGIGIRI